MSFPKKDCIFAIEIIKTILKNYAAKVKYCPPLAISDLDFVVPARSVPDERRGAFCISPV